jgi:hypothetical protein
LSGGGRNEQYAKPAMPRRKYCCVRRKKKQEQAFALWLSEQSFHIIGKFAIAF